MTKYDMLNTSLEEDMKYLEANEDVDPRILNLIAAKLIKENNIIYMYSYLKHAVNASDSILKYMVIRLINYDEYSNEVINLLIKRKKVNLLNYLYETVDNDRLNIFIDILKEEVSNIIKSLSLEEKQMFLESIKDKEDYFEIKNLVVLNNMNNLKDTLLLFRLLELYNSYMCNKKQKTYKKCITQ